MHELYKEEVVSAKKRLDHKIIKHYCLFDSQYLNVAIRDCLMCCNCLYVVIHSSHQLDKSYLDKSEASGILLSSSLHSRTAKVYFSEYVGLNEILLIGYDSKFNIIESSSVIFLSETEVMIKDIID